jgi:uncharacterized protein YkwD
MRIAMRVLAVMSVGFAFLSISLAQTGAPAAEQALFASVNRARKAQGMAALKWNERLAAAAQQHAKIMAQRGATSHGFSGEPSLASRVTQAGVRFVWLAENVCQGSDSEAIEAEFLKSANHRANILDTDMDSIGVGAVERGGQWFVVEDFAKVR